MFTVATSVNTIRWSDLNVAIGDSDRYGRFGGQTLTSQVEAPEVQTVKLSMTTQLDAAQVPRIKF